MRIPSLIILCCQKHRWTDPFLQKIEWWAYPPGSIYPKRITFSLFDNEMCEHALKMEIEWMTNNPPQSVIQFCQENHWTDIQFIENSYWAFPPNCVIPQRIEL